MTAQPFSWNVVVVGSWNTAILTPDGVAKRLFDLAEKTPVEIAIPIDRRGPYRISHDGIGVIASSHQLEVSPDRPDIPSLARAAQVAKRALASLPETPFFAAGVNFRFKYEVLPDSLLELSKAPIDDVLSDASFHIAASATKRGLVVSPGVLNLEIDQGEDVAGHLTMNFHRDSSARADLDAWLSRVEEFHETAQRILSVVDSDSIGANA